MQDVLTMRGILGITGEYFVAAELAQRGAIATLTMKNTPRVDIIAVSLSTGRVVNIQVKTRSKYYETADWRLSSKDEASSELRNLFYIFVKLRGEGILPEYYIVPQKEVSDIIHSRHEEYMKRRKRDREERKDTTMRGFPLAIAKKYKDRWELLGL